MNENEQPEWGVKLSKYFVIPQRFIVAIFGFLAIVNAYTMRICLSMALTQMVVYRNHTKMITDPKEIVCPSTINKADTHGGIYDWTEEEQGRILSFFYIGYVVTHLPGGVMAYYFGSKWILFSGIFLAAMLTLFTPLIVFNHGSTGLFVSRIFVGLCEGTTYPALSVMLSHWAPAKERGKLGALALGGGQVGTIISYSVSGLLLKHYHWSIVFYVFGAVALFWCLFFSLLCYSDPITHPFIKSTEREYLINEMGGIERSKLPQPPVLAIFSNVPMYALIVAQLGHDWGFYIMATDLPKYFNDVLNIDINENGLYASLPYVLMWIFSIVSGAIADIIISRELMSITNIRKVMTAIAAFGPAIFFIGASYSGCNRIAVISCFSVAMGLMGTYYAGMKLTPLDMSPNYAGILTAIANGLGSLTGFLAPYSVGLMAPDGTLMQWRKVFWVAFAILIVSAIVFTIWGSGEVQEFNDPIAMKEKKEAKKRAQLSEKSDSK